MSDKNQQWRTHQMIRLILVSLAVTMITGMANAQDTTVYGKFRDQFPFEEFGFTQYDEPVFQGGVTVSWENGVFADVWTSQALNGDVQGAEFDYTLGWSGGCWNISCTVSVSLFDIPTPDVGDFDFTGQDVIRFRLELSDTFTVSENDSVTLIAGVEQLTGLIETNMWRTAATWNRDLNPNWSTSLLVGATFNADTDDLTPRWTLDLTRSFENWSIYAELVGYEPPAGGGHEVTTGVGFSFTF